jgi:hypothetical protein
MNEGDTNLIDFPEDCSESGVERISFLGEKRVTGLSALETNFCVCESHAGCKDILSWAGARHS